ncbi:MAG TPA: pantoate--beta-alanine ligase [Acetobacteraceae bacterium]|nr:pantoate--beta-alanine ligase [Acetobacteraceae bacterium]
MQVVRTLAQLRSACASLRQLYGSVCLVPTMGALHAGHSALIRAAVQSGGAVVASIFVNPLQFGPNEDLLRYPRDESGDLNRLEEAGCHLAWLPDVATMYPPGDATTVNVNGPGENWEGAARPGHFRGVATVCAKLFGQVRPDRAYFGEKDWQQFQVVRRMVADLLLPLEIVGIETVREPDGLAMSSRNRFLSAAERAVAPRLHATMQSVAKVLAAGGPAAEVLAAAQRDLTHFGFAVDYFALVDGPTLHPLPSARSAARLIAAAKLGSVRLIDNIAV